MTDIENPMVLRRGYGIFDRQEESVKYTGVCEGCKEEVIHYDPTLPVEDGLIHDDWQCAYLYVKRYFG